MVHARTAGQPKKVYRALRDMGTGYLQFIPCLDPLEGSPQAWSLQPEAYGRFLCGVFDCWEEDWRRGQYVSIRQFEDWVRMAAGLPPDTCASCGACGSYLVAEADGSLYPCDFYALDAWRLGDVDTPLTEVMGCERMLAFRRRALRKPDACAVCRFLYLCRGGCPRNWSGTGGLHNTLCSAYCMFFTYAEERLREMARLLRS